MKQVSQPSPLYYKGDTLLLQEKVDDYDVSKVPGEESS